MKQEELIAIIAEETNVTKTEIKQHLQLIIKHVFEELEKGNQVDIKGYGKFVVTTIGEHEGRNPYTGERIMIPETKRVKFITARKFRDTINRG